MIHLTIGHFTQNGDCTYYCWLSCSFFKHAKELQFYKVVS